VCQNLLLLGLNPSTANWEGAKAPQKKFDMRSKLPALFLLRKMGADWECALGGGADQRRNDKYSREAREEAVTPNARGIL
jgi:hypothetical protein